MLIRIIEDVKKCLDAKAYFAALTLALTIPDICGRAEFPNYKKKKRYINWYDRYNRFEPVPGRENIPHMSGNIVYDLRCQMLHIGNPGIEDKTRINRFIIEYETNNEFIGGNSISARINTTNNEVIYCTYRFNLNSFCKSMCAVAEWYYSENKVKFDFYDYELVNRDEQEKHQLTKEQVDKAIKALTNK